MVSTAEQALSEDVRHFKSALYHVFRGICHGLRHEHLIITEQETGGKTETLFGIPTYPNMHHSMKLAIRESLIKVGVPHFKLDHELGEDIFIYQGSLSELASHVNWRAFQQECTQKLRGCQKRGEVYRG